MSLPPPLLYAWALLYNNVLPAAQCNSITALHWAECLNVSLLCPAPSDAADWACTYVHILWYGIYFILVFCILIVSLFACCTPHNSQTCPLQMPLPASTYLKSAAGPNLTWNRDYAQKSVQCTYLGLLHIPYVYICTLFGIKTMLYLRNRHALVSLNTFYIPLCLCILRLTRSSLQMKMSIALTVCILGDPYFVHFTWYLYITIYGLFLFLTCILWPISVFWIYILYTLTHTLPW